jgi:hypothetical protein
LNRIFRWASAIVALLTTQLVVAGSAYADSRVEIPAIERVMAGSSSTGSDQVWAMVHGTLAGVPSDCVYGDKTLFYLPANSGFMNPDKALAVLLSAKAAGAPVTIVYSVEAPADFYWFGITRCVINRLAY